jgi:hypothetical protein
MPDSHMHLSPETKINIGNCCYKAETSLGLIRGGTHRCYLYFLHPVVYNGIGLENDLHYSVHVIKPQLFTYVIYFISTSNIYTKSYIHSRPIPNLIQ